MTQWLALWPHSRKVPGFVLQASFVSARWVLPFPPIVQRHACQVNLVTLNLWLVTCPGCTPSCSMTAETPPCRISSRRYWMDEVNITPLKSSIMSFKPNVDKFNNYHLYPTYDLVDVFIVFIFERKS